MEHSKRLEDRTGETWSGAFRNQCIERRFQVAASPADLALREGTKELWFDEMKEITWGDVMEVLGRIGTVPISDGRPVRLESIMEDDRRNREANLTLADNPEALSGFLLPRFREQERRSRLKHGQEDHSAKIPTLATKAATMLAPLLPLNYDKYREVFIQLEDLIATELGVKRAQMSEQWASVLHDVVNHPSVTI